MIDLRVGPSLKTWAPAGSPETCFNYFDLAAPYFHEGCGPRAFPVQRRPTPKPEFGFLTPVFSWLEYPVRRKYSEWKGHGQGNSGRWAWFDQPQPQAALAQAAITAYHPTKDYFLVTASRLLIPKRNAQRPGGIEVPSNV